MNAVLLDSDILIEIARARDKNLCAQWEELSRSDTAVSCSPVTVAEIWHGARPGEFPIIGRLFDSIECIPIGSDIGRRAGEFLRRYRKSHHTELGDALIAATAPVHGLAPWTRNRKHYPMKDLAFFPRRVA